MTEPQPVEQNFKDARPDWAGNIKSFGRVLSKLCILTYKFLSILLQTWEREAASNQITLFFLTAANLEKYQGTRGPLKKKKKETHTERRVLLVPKQHSIAKKGALRKIRRRSLHFLLSPLANPNFYLFIKKWTVCAWTKSDSPHHPYPCRSIRFFDKHSLSNEAKSMA